MNAQITIFVSFGDKTSLTFPESCGTMDEPPPNPLTAEWLKDNWAGEMAPYAVWEEPMKSNGLTSTCTLLYLIDSGGYDMEDVYVVKRSEKGVGKIGDMYLSTLEREFKFYTEFVKHELDAVPADNAHGPHIIFNAMFVPKCIVAWLQEGSTLVLEHLGAPSLERAPGSGY